MDFRARRDAAPRNDGKLQPQYRFRDDVLIVTGGKKSPQEIEAIRQKYALIYGKSLQIELESFSHEKTIFLESKIEVKHGKVQLWNNNKNWNDDAIGKNRQLQIRYPNVRSNYPTSIFVTTMIGTLKKLNSTTSSKQHTEFAIFQHLCEWKIKNYKLHWVKRALQRSNIPDMLLWRKVMKFIWHTATDAASLFVSVQTQGITDPLEIMKNYK